MTNPAVAMTSAVCRRCIRCNHNLVRHILAPNPVLPRRIVDDEWSRLLTARLLHSLLACDLNSAVTLQVMYHCEYH
jgi:hypothetical protein